MSGMNIYQQQLAYRDSLQNRKETRLSKNFSMTNMLDDRNREGNAGQCIWNNQIIEVQSSQLRKVASDVKLPRIE